MNVYTNEYVGRFVLSLDHISQAKTRHLFNLLKKYGNLLGMPHVKKLNSALYELRIRGKQEVRIIFIIWNKNCYLLHGFIKKTQKTPKKEVDTAMKRFSLLK